MKLPDRLHRPPLFHCLERPPPADRGVSPVIGVVLMVAITVVLASVIGTFVLGFGGSAGGHAPSASLDVTFDVASDDATLVHRGGDGLADERTRLVLENESSGASLTFDPGDSDDVFAVGDELVIDAATGSVSSDTDVWAGRGPGGAGFAISPGFPYSVQVIDTEHQQVVYETTLVA